MAEMPEDLGQNPARRNLQTQVTEFLRHTGPIEDLQELAGPLLACECTLRQVIQAAGPEVQKRFVDKVDQVCDLDRFAWSFC